MQKEPSIFAVASFFVALCGWTGLRFSVARIFADRNGDCFLCNLFLKLQTAFDINFKVCMVYFLVSKIYRQHLTLGLASVGLDVVSFGCSSLSAAVPADG